MDHHGIIIKRLISFPGNILIHNFQIQSPNLEAILQNQLVTFQLRPERPSLRFCQNWLIRNESIGNLELKNISSFLGDSARTSGKISIQEGDQSNKQGLNSSDTEADLLSNGLDMMDGVEVMTSKFSLDNLGLIQDISIFNKDAVSILSKTEKSTRLLTFKMSELNQQFRARNRKLNQMVLNADESQLVAEDSLANDMGLEGLIENVRDRQLEGAKLAFAFETGYLVGFGVRLVLFSKSMLVQRTWNFESIVASVCPVAFARGSEVR